MMIVGVPSPALPDLRPALRLAGPAQPFASVQGRRTAGAAARGCRAAPYQAQAPAGLGRSRGPRRAEPIPAPGSSRALISNPVLMPPPPNDASTVNPGNPHQGFQRNAFLVPA